MNRLYLVRHGENLANLTLEFSCRKVDYSLTPKGLLQAQQTAAFLQDQGIEEIYSSPLKRTVETAQAIAAPLGLPVTVMEAFREINVGEIEGQKPTPELWAQHNAILNAWSDGHPETYFPGGENLPMLLGRLREGLGQVLAGKDGRKILIAGHGGVIWFGLRKLCQGVDWSRLATHIDNCSITELDASFIDGQLELRLLSLNSTAHLSGEAAQLVSGLMEAAGQTPEK